MVKIWLDDEREAPDDFWLIARSIEPIKVLLEAGLVQVLSLDNDLGLGQPEGHCLVDWMVQTGHWPTGDCFVHSRNVVAAKRMTQDIVTHFFNRNRDAGWPNGGPRGRAF